MRPMWFDEIYQVGQMSQNRDRVTVKTHGHTHTNVRGDKDDS